MSRATRRFQRAAISRADVERKPRLAPRRPCVERGNELLGQTAPFVELANRQQTGVTGQSPRRRFDHNRLSAQKSDDICKTVCTLTVSLRVELDVFFTASSPECVGRIRHNWAFQTVFLGIFPHLTESILRCQIVPTPNAGALGTCLYNKCRPMSPFRLRPRVGPRPAFPGVDARAKVDGAAPFVEPEPRSLTTESTNYFTHRYW